MRNVLRLKQSLQKINRIFFFFKNENVMKRRSSDTASSLVVPLGALPLRPCHLLNDFTLVDSKRNTSKYFLAFL